MTAVLLCLTRSSNFFVSIHRNIRVCPSSRGFQRLSWRRSAARKILSCVEPTRVNMQDTKEKCDRAFSLSITHANYTRRMARKRVSNYLSKISDQYAGINRLVIATNLLIHYQPKKEGKSLTSYESVLVRSNCELNDS